MKILVITLPPWRDDKGDGNVLTNLFSEIDAEFANIYCMSGLPSNNICNKYYQMTDKMAIKNILKHTPMGKQLGENDLKPLSYEAQKESEDKSFYTFFWKHKWELFYVIREMIWCLSDWRNEQLKQFVLSFQPDVIYAPIYANCFTLKLVRYICDLTKVPLISPLYDDVYSLRQFHLNPIYWFHRFAIRYEIRKTMNYVSLINTFSPLQKQYCENTFHKETLIIPKSGQSHYSEKTVEYPIRIIYAGGIYQNRWKTLVRIADAVSHINTDVRKFRLDIYTDNELYDKNTIQILNDGKNCFLHKAIPFDELQKIYASSDIALHAESFDLKNKLFVKMSFSTKIVDCLESGCAVLAIADENQVGLAYLKNEDAAICITDPNQIKSVLSNLSDNFELIREYKLKAKNCLEKNHNKNQIAHLLESEIKLVTTASKN